jgi:hypothetical protein
MTAFKESPGSVEGAPMNQIVVIVVAMTLVWLALIGLAASTVYARKSE